MAAHVARAAKRAGLQDCASSSGVLKEGKNPSAGLNSVKKALCATGAVVFLGCVGMQSSSATSGPAARMESSSASDAEANVWSQLQTTLPPAALILLHISSS